MTRQLFRTENRPYLVLAAVWGFLWADWSAWYGLPSGVHWVGFTVATALGWIWWDRRRRRNLRRLERRLLLLPVALLSWQWLVFASSELGWVGAARFFTLFGLSLFFFVGLCLAVWIVEKRTQVYAARPSHVPAMAGQRVWDLCSLEAWYLRKRSQKLDQSLWTFLLYTLLFLFLVLILSHLPGCREIYEMPAGGGEQAQLQKVKIEKIIRKKLVINPFSSIVFNPPPIEDIKLRFQELTRHAYQVGFGEGEGSGFAGGTSRGKVRFIRLEYQGGDWDQDFSGSSDLNMLLEYGIRTGHKVADQPESRRISQLKNFPIGKSPPFLYITGQRNLLVSNSEVEILREYLTEKRGMLFADNGGSAGWGQQFFALMQKTLPRVKPIRVPLDHPIHTTPYPIPFLPYVAPHGGKEAWGWVVDGRLVAYYHPGDIGDAWADDHAKIRREIWEYCYQLGTNVIFYSHVEYNKWLDTLNENKPEGKE